MRKVAVFAAGAAVLGASAKAWCDPDVAAELVVKALRDVLPDQVRRLALGVRLCFMPAVSWLPIILQCAHYSQAPAPSPALLLPVSQAAPVPAEWHRWSVEAADAAQDRVSAWLRAQTGELHANPFQVAGSPCCAAQIAATPAEAAQCCASTLSRHTADGGGADSDRGSQRWLQQREPSAADRQVDDHVDWTPAAEEGAARGQMRPAMFSEKGCTATLAAEHRHWLRLIRRQLQVMAAIRQQHSFRYSTDSVSNLVGISRHFSSCKTGDDA